jgi:hypothetical protein
MAAYRQSVPLRQSSGIFRIDDGTMCRTPSPLPGPLRGEFGFEPSGLSGNLRDGLLPVLSSGASAQENRAVLAVGKAA